MAYLDPRLFDDKYRLGLFKDHSPSCFCDICGDIRKGIQPSQILLNAYDRGEVARCVCSSCMAYLECMCTNCAYKNWRNKQALATLKRFSLFFSLQFLNYSLLCWNMRAVAFGWVGNVVASDLLIAALSFTLIKKVAEAKDKTAMWGYIAGGAVGSACSVLLTRYLWGA